LNLKDKLITQEEIKFEEGILQMSISMCSMFAKDSFILLN